MFAWILTILLFFAPSASAEFGLVSGLNSANRKDVLKVLGLGTTGKNVSLPIGLGSNHGLEISLANEFIDTTSVSQFITNSDSKSTLYYPKISIGKGIYDRTDLFIHFIPYTATLGLSEYGGTLRYNFYRPSNSVFSASAVVSMNSANFNNQLTARGVGGDLSLGMTWDYFSMFTSVGMAKSTGLFIGGTQGTTDSLQNETEEISDMHYSVGFLTRYKIYFLSAALDHYTEPVYTLKLGCLF